MTPYAHRKLKEMEDLVNSWDPETRRSFVHDLNTNTPKSSVQIRLARYGITVRDLRRWANKNWPNVKAH
jgi:hypothetical protein